MDRKNKTEERLDISSFGFLKKGNDASILEYTVDELDKQRILYMPVRSVYATEPEVYVLDEPSSNLDAKAVLRLKSILGRLKKTGKTSMIWN